MANKRPTRAMVEAKRAFARVLVEDNPEIDVEVVNKKLRTEFQHGLQPHTIKGIIREVRLNLGLSDGSKKSKTPDVDLDIQYLVRYWSWQRDFHPYAEYTSCLPEEAA